MKKMLGIAPCNISPNNIMECDIANKRIVCVRYNCGKIKWKEKGYKKGGHLEQKK